MKLSRVSAIGLLLAVAGSGEAMAQSVDTRSDCLVLTGDVYFNACAAGNLSRLNSIHIPYAVARAVANSFHIGPVLAEPAGLEYLIAADADERLRHSGMLIVPTADAATAAPAAPVKWNVWGNGRYVHSDYSLSGGGLEGGTSTGIAGLDYKVTDKFTLGLLATAESSNLDSALDDFNSETLGVGPYLGLVLTDNIVFSANAQRSWIDSDTTGGALNFDTDRIQASAALNGYWYRGLWRLNPSLTLTWSKDWEEEENGLFPDRVIEVGVLVPALQIGNTLRLSDTTTMEPWAGAALDVTFLNDVKITGLPDTSDPNTDLRLQAGLNFGFGSNAQLAFTGEASGLLLEDFDNYSVEANLAVQF
jgi:hypothetical protein